MTRALSDTRYGQVIRLRASAGQTVTNSTTLTDSTYLQQALSAGSYEVIVYAKISADTDSTKGVRVNVTYTGTFSNVCGLTNWGVNAATTPGDTASNNSSAAPVSTSSFVTISGGSAAVIVRATFDASTSGTLKFQFCQNSAAAGTSCTLLTDSKMIIRSLY